MNNDMSRITEYKIPDNSIVNFLPVFSERIENKIEAINPPKDEMVPNNPVFTRSQ